MDALAGDVATLPFGAGAHFARGVWRPVHGGLDLFVNRMHIGIRAIVRLPTPAPDCGLTTVPSCAEGRVYLPKHQDRLYAETELRRYCTVR